jgi:hypothetical protein
LCRTNRACQGELFFFQLNSFFGSPFSEQVAEQMVLDGLENVHKEPVSGISNWKRNEESVQMLQPRYLELPMVGLGGSIAGNVTGGVVAVADWDELKERADEVMIDTAK